MGVVLQSSWLSGVSRLETGPEWLQAALPSRQFFRRPTAGETGTGRRVKQSYKYIYIYIYRYIYEHTYTHIHVCTYVYTYACIYTCMYVCVHLHVCICAYMYVFAYVYVHVSRSVSMSTSLSVSLSISLSTSTAHLYLMMNTQKSHGFARPTNPGMADLKKAAALGSTFSKQGRLDPSWSALTLA